MSIFFLYAFLSLRINSRLIEICIIFISTDTNSFKSLSTTSTVSKYLWILLRSLECSFSRSSTSVCSVLQSSFGAQVFSWQVSAPYPGVCIMRYLFELSWVDPCLLALISSTVIASISLFGGAHPTINPENQCVGESFDSLGLVNLFSSLVLISKHSKVNNCFHPGWKAFHHCLLSALFLLRTVTLFTRWVF